MLFTRNPPEPEEMLLMLVWDGLDVTCAGYNTICSTLHRDQADCSHHNNTLGTILGMLGRVMSVLVRWKIPHYCLVMVCGGAGRVLSEEQCSNSTSQEANLRNRRPQPICLQEQNREYTQVTSHYQQYLPQASTLLGSLSPVWHWCNRTLGATY